MAKTWHDQHLKTCACKKCALKPKKLPDKPQISKELTPEAQENIATEYQKVLDKAIPIASGTKITFTTTLTTTTKFPSDKYVPAGTYLKINNQIVNGPVTLTTTARNTGHPKTKLLDSSNPFAKALDAWRGGQAGWIKGALYQPESDDDPFDSSYS